MTQTLSVIISIYNEEKNLRELLNKLFNTPCSLEREWILIDDGSTDSSYQISLELQSKYEYKLIRHQNNVGKGFAIRRGIAEARGDFIMFQDADFEYDPNDIQSLLLPLIDKKADVVYGSRFKHKSKYIVKTCNYFANRFLTTMSNLLTGIRLTDMETCYKVFRKDLIQAMNLRSRRFGIEVELTAYICKIGVRVYELPINYYPRTQWQGKKINWKDGIAALWHICFFNLLISRDKAFTNLPEKYTKNSAQILK